MNLTLSILNNTVNKLKCSSCNNYLSYFPIYLTDGDKSVCGRCKIPEGNIILCHNKVFEEIAQYIQFPCRYEEQGCCEELLPENVPSHEKHCQFKIVECPGNEFINCSWQGTRNEMLLHCRNSHQDVYLKDDGFELNGNNTNLFRFVEHNEVLFIFSLNHDLFKQASLMVYHIDEDTRNLENCPYQVVFKKNKTHLIVENITTSYLQRNWCKVALDSLTIDNPNETSSITGHVIFEKSVDDVNLARKAFNDRFLSLLECSSCGGYVFPPVQCLCKRLKCGFCNNFNVQLPCESSCEFGSELDEIVKILDYPCRFKANGCNAVLKCEKMAKHISICSFNDEYCDYCEWSGLRKDLKRHFLEKHRELIVQNGEKICVEDIDTSLNRVVVYDNHLFVFEFEVSKYRSRRSRERFHKSYRWSVNLMKEIEEDFQYEIEITNPEFSDTKVLMQYKRFILHENDTFAFDNVLEFLGIIDSVIFKINILKC